MVTLTYQNGKTESYESFQKAWEVVSEMVENDDIVFVNVNTDNNMIKIRKGC